MLYVVQNYAHTCVVVTKSVPFSIYILKKDIDHWLHCLNTFISALDNTKYSTIGLKTISGLCKRLV